jgi:ASC-1-like (ASCH) protein
MEHIAIMRKSWGLLDRILTGEKTIESRWYSVRYRPWDAVRKGERVYFKNSGESVTVRARVARVVQFENLTPRKVSAILREYGRRDGLRPEEINSYYRMFRSKKYCLLIFLQKSQKLRPFEINKKGFGAMSAWLTVKSVNVLKKK